MSTNQNQPSGASATDLDSGASYFSDSETDNRPPAAAKSPSDLLSGVYRGIKKLAPTREDSVKSLRTPTLSGKTSFLSTPLASFAGPPTALHSAPLPESRDRPASQKQHARSLSLQDSLAKPLPHPPPAESPPPDELVSTPKQTLLYPPTSLPPTTTGLSLDTIIDDELEPETETDRQRDAANRTRTTTMESGVSTGSPTPMYQGAGSSQETYDLSSSQTSLASIGATTKQEDPSSAADANDGLTPRSNGPMSAGPSPSVNQHSRTSGNSQPQSASSSHLSGLMCNVHRTTGREPHALVGATTTIVGDKLYVFGGRILSRSRPAPLTSDLYELDLIRRHWTKLETGGDIPPPRYFHSMCALGDTKLVCYGGMSPSANSSTPAAGDQQPELTVMSDIYIYDVATRKWVFINTPDAPEGRYAHCATIAPSSAAFSSSKAPLSALHHNPSSSNPNEGRLGVSIDGTGGSEMIIVGGQDAANHYIEQISVFNLRSLKWTTTQPLGKSCGAYRSVVAPVPPAVTARIGKGQPNGPQRPEGGAREAGSSMLIYSNYNFLDVKLELQVRSPDGALTEKSMVSAYSPPGLRFPNGGVIDNFFVVSGTYLTSSKQEYALWALDLRTLTWSRIDAGGSVFSQGSWNRGVLWSRRNTFVILGNRKRSLVDDYNHRRINFSNVCMVELEAFGFYDNPRKVSPMSGFVSASSPYAGPGLSVARKAGYTAGGRAHSRASEELGEKALGMRELADMDLLCITGERIPINSRILARRWGPYFVQLLREGTATQDGSDSVTLRSGMGNPTRSSSIPGGASERNTIGSTASMASTLVSSAGSSSAKPPSTAGSSISGGLFSPGAGGGDPVTMATINTAPTPRTLPPNSRPRCLYLPHTYLTVQALLHFLYTSTLAPTSSPLCTPQILCSLLQVARPYRIDGLLEAVVERLHALLDSRNAAAVFNATAMAAGGGRGIDGTLNPNFFVHSDQSASGSEAALGQQNGGSSTDNLAARTSALRINTSVSGRPSSEDLSATSVSGSEFSSELGDSAGERAEPREIWSGELSSVIGLQKRGLRGLMEGRRMRERTGTNASMGSGGYGQQARVGLGIAGS
ncbi:related to ral2 protein [Cephalotrichum gorgonifer]|uniref:Related to ral2 protein n=1 Tax=Cephalotrichum gorgonifer TaxID=2041049 RepID=A0AAE8N778_9PEZI|nr:related to ral2 protein [Cephalotrichum gorgonifer]